MSNTPNPNNKGNKRTAAALATLAQWQDEARDVAAGVLVLAEALECWDGTTQPGVRTPADHMNELIAQAQRILAEPVLQRVLLA